MGPAGATEIIAHFAGYLRIGQDFSRVRLDFDGAPAPHDRPWSADPVHAPHRAPVVEDPTGGPVRLTVPPGNFALIGVHPHGSHGSHPVPLSPAHGHLVHVPPEAAPSPVIPGFGLASTSSGPVPAPDQALVVIEQVNVMRDDDVVLMGPGTAVTTLHAGHIDDIAPLVAQVKAPVPDWLPDTVGNQALVDVVAHHDAATLLAGTAGAPTLLEGVTIDGVAQPAGSGLAPVVPANPAVDGDTSHNGMTNPGLEAQTGGNVAVNIATILDDHTQHTGLIVAGDAYTTNAIVQVNVLSSLAEIAVGGPTAALAIVTGGNTATNTASLTIHPTDVGSVDHFSAGAHVVVDQIDGNFYDVKGLEQVNYLHDNDVVVHGTLTSYFAIDAGNNTQINYLPLDELNQTYDLIVVQGSWHASNIILQQNVLLNDDIVKMLTSRDDTAQQSVTTGANGLQNTAGIDLYGTQAYQPLPASTLATLQGIETGKLDPALLAGLQGNGTDTLHVLYIKGDYYDINTVIQTNIVGNVDTVVQDLPNPGTTTAANGVTTTSTETIDTGHNQLANVAGIATVGTTSAFQFVGGQHYDDAILVQANYVSDKATVTLGDTHALAAEVMAFTGLHDVATHPMDPSQHHDLFHGMMA